MLDPTDVPVIPRGVRLHEDKVRGRWVLLAPERTIDLDSVGHAILSEIDDNRTFETIVASLAQKYDAPADQISGDASDFIEGLMDRRILEVAP